MNALVGGLTGVDKACLRVSESFSGPCCLMLFVNRETRNAV